MRYVVIRAVIAFLTFGIGVTSARLWFVLPHHHVRQFEHAAPQSPNVSDNTDAENADQDCLPAFEGRYSNYDYAFAVEVPRGMIGFGSCVTNHGFGIDLSNPSSGLWANQEAFPKAYLYVDASHNSLFWESFDAAIRGEMSYLDDKATHIVLVRRTRTRLAGLRAVRFIVHYRKDDEEMVRDEVLAFRKEKWADYVYTIGLTTPLSRYEKDKAVVTEMQNTWRLQQLP